MHTLRIAAQRPQATSESVDTTARQAEGRAVRLAEFLGTKCCPHQTRQIVMGRAEKHVTDFMSEHTPERTPELGIEHDPDHRRWLARGSKGQHTLRRIE